MKTAADVKKAAKAITDIKKAVKAAADVKKAVRREDRDMLRIFLGHG